MEDKQLGKRDGVRAGQNHRRSDPKRTKIKTKTKKKSKVNKRFSSVTKKKK